MLQITSQTEHYRSGILFRSGRHNYDDADWTEEQRAAIGGDILLKIKGGDRAEDQSIDDQPNDQTPAKSSGKKAAKRKDKCLR